jgi:hypothetical protein
MTKKKKTGAHSPDHGKAESSGHERRTTGERRADDRRAHARFSPAEPRTERRQGERRGNGT